MRLHLFLTSLLCLSSCISAPQAHAQSPSTIHWPIQRAPDPITYLDDSSDPAVLGLTPDGARVMVNHALVLDYTRLLTLDHCRAAHLGAGVRPDVDTLTGSITYTIDPEHYQLYRRLVRAERVTSHAAAPHQ